MNHYTDADVDRVLEGVDLTPVLREAFVALARGEAAQQERIRSEAGGVKLSTLGAVLPAQGYAGAKVYTTIEGRFSFLITLFSAATGHPVATFDAGAITRRRTAAVSLLAARAASDRPPEAIAVFGGGVQGRGHAEAFSRAFPKAALRIVPRQAAEADVRSALSGARIVITATRSATPLFPGDWVEAGSVVCAVGSSRPDTRELDDRLLARARRVVVEWKPQALREAGDLLLAAPDVRGKLDVVNLGDVLAGHEAARRGPEDIVVFKSVGVGLEDVAVAGLAYERLREP